MTELEELQEKYRILSEEFQLRVDYAQECRALQYEVNCLKSEIRMLTMNTPKWSSKEAAEAGTENWIE